MNSTKVPSKPLSEIIHSYLRNAIIKNEIKPKEIIREKDIAAIFNSSTTPVREAIKRLASEGFVEVHAYRHATVSEITYKEYEEISETMYALDSYAHKLVINDLTEKDHQELRNMIFEMEKYCQSDTLEKYLEINVNIHIYIWESLRNEFLYTLIRQVFDKFLHSHRHILFTQWARNESALKKSMRIHKKMMKALIEKDTSHINSILKKHWSL